VKATLVICGDDKLVREFPVEDAVELGRKATGFDLVLRRQGQEVLLGVRDATVSKRHALLYVEQGKLLVKDLGSSNGTLVNNRILPNWQPKKESEPLEIKGDACLRLGATEIEIKVAAPPGYEELAKMMQELKLEAELKRRHSEKDAQRLANSFRVILDLNNNCCNTHTRVKEVTSRLENLKLYLQEEEFLAEVSQMQRKLTAELFEEEFLGEKHVQALKDFCNRFVERWGAKFMV
jgi:hypothetical protein